MLCEYVVDCGTELTLYPYPLNEAPWRFTGWLGDDAALVGSGGVVEMTEDIALVAGFTPEWALVLEDPGITADPEPYYTGRYLDGVEVMLTAVPMEGGYRLQASDLRLQEEGIRLQTSGIRLQEEGFRQQASDYRPQASGSRFPLFSAPL